MAEQGTHYRMPKAFRMYMEQLEKHPPFVWPELEFLTVKLDGPIESTEELIEMVKNYEEA